MKNRLIVLLVCLLLVPCVAFAELTVYFLDVGQGDSAIIVCDGEAMIIDGGLPGKSSVIFSYLKDTLKIDRIVYMVATHPDNDHIGGLQAVFETSKVKYLYSPVKEDDSPFFSELADKAEKQGVKIKIPYNKSKESLGKATVSFYNSERKKKNIVRKAIDWFKAKFNRDDPEEFSENNDISLVVKITYGETSFLFTGDIEKEAEDRLISEGIDLKADVLKVAHHGSNTSSSIDFITKVDPDYAIISCGEGNRYRHPNQETLDELKQEDIELYRTDLQGTIVFTSDGHTISVKPDRKATGDVFSAPEKQQ